MKRIIVALLALMIPLSLCSAQEETLPAEEKAFTAKPFMLFNEGVAMAQVTRLQRCEGRTNFVWQDALVGAFFSTQTKQLPVRDLYLRVQAFYPFQHQFNGMKQFSAQTLLYAFDLLAGPVFEPIHIKNFALTVKTGLHYMYQLSDEYHLNYLGLGITGAVEYKVYGRWSVLADGTLTVDSANLGSNRNVQPYDYSWQWGGSLGVRYSRK